MPDEAADALRQLPHESALVFTFEGRDVSHGTATRALHGICDSAHVVRFGWHVFRHTYASRLVTAGAHLQAVQQLLGHQTMDMTQRYAHLAPDYLRSTVELLNTPPTPRATGGQHPSPTSTERSPNRLAATAISPLNSEKSTTSP